MKLILSPLYPSGLFLLVVSLLVAGQPYTPTDEIKLNCGSSGESQTWNGDIKSELSPIEVGSASKVMDGPRSSSTAGQVPYTTARLSRSEFTYRIPVRPGQKFIRLYFYPASYKAVNGGACIEEEKHYYFFVWRCMYWISSHKKNSYPKINYYVSEHVIIPLLINISLSN
ncbi:hypothetical protein ACLB2K_054326 [Fragaria x ananassa]